MNEMDFPGNLVVKNRRPPHPATSNSGDMGSIPDWGTKVLHASQNSEEKVLCVRGAGEGVEVQA